MATKKAPVRASRGAPARVPSKLAILPPAPVAVGTLVLVFRGGADLSFRDGSGTKRRVLRGVPFIVDAATAELLLATDPTVSLADLEPDEAIVPSPAPAVAADAPQGGNEPADDPGAVAPGEAGTPPEAPPEPPVGDMPSGAITLGDIPAGGRVGGNGG